jgi:integrase
MPCYPLTIDQAVHGGLTVWVSAVALRRQLKPTIKKLGLPATVDFRSFRTMHSSLMSSVGVRPEVTRVNMGHATIDVTQNVYNKTWWEERVEAVSMAAASVWREFMSTPQVPAAI